MQVGVRFEVFNATNQVSHMSFQPCLLTLFSSDPTCLSICPPTTRPHSATLHCQQNYQPAPLCPPLPNHYQIALSHPLAANSCPKVRLSPPAHPCTPLTRQSANTSLPTTPPPPPPQHPCLCTCSSPFLTSGLQITVCWDPLCKIHRSCCGKC